MQQESVSDRIVGLFHEDLTFTDMDAGDSQSLLVKLGRIAFEAGLVKESFTPALLEREALYPTGLLSNEMGFAIPHTDAEHVIRPCVIAVKPRRPVRFGEMGSVDRTVEANYIFLLLLNNNGTQVPLLQGLMALCSDRDSAQELNRAVMAHDVYRAITGFLGRIHEQEGGERKESATNTGKEG